MNRRAARIVGAAFENIPTRWLKTGMNVVLRLVSEDSPGPQGSIQPVVLALARIDRVPRRSRNIGERTMPTPVAVCHTVTGNGNDNGNGNGGAPRRYQH